MYLYLHWKTRMNKRFLYIDNLFVTAISFLICLLAYYYFFQTLNQVFRFLLSFISGSLSVVLIGFLITMLRFFYTPHRKISSAPNEIVSPADGNVIYIKKIEQDCVPISIKNGSLSTLEELTKSNLLKSPCWLIGINLTPFDVHKNCAPVDGKIILNKHTAGSFFSLKLIDALKENERNTLIIENDVLQVGVVQIASKLVRRIDSYIKEGDNIKKGEWFGMIRFGSQVDIILPACIGLKIETGKQVYAGKTVIGVIS